MTDLVRVVALGLPGPQGSKRFVGRAKSGRGILVESSAKVKPWREAVKWAAFEAMAAWVRAQREEATAPVPPFRPLCGPLVVRMVFTLPKPASAPKRRQTFPDRKPDLSKLVRATEDALTDAGLWRDDGQVVECLAAKRYPGEGLDALAVPGCVIEVRPLVPAD